MKAVDEDPFGNVLVADLGGTTARFGIVDGRGSLRHRVEFASDDHAGPAEGARIFLDELGEGERPRRGVFAVAGPVTGDRVRLTNRDWDFSLEATRGELGLESLLAVNDFAALALALPALAGQDLRRVKEGHRVQGAAMAVLGPGTGLGVAGVVPTPGGWWPMAGEGGHRDLAVQTAERELRVFAALAEGLGHVSAEDVLSGPGLVRVTSAIRSLEGLPAEPSEPRQVVERAGEDPGSPEAEAVGLFSTWLGAVAGDLALTFDARGGIFLGGGILPRMGPLFDEEAFRERFLAKGRYREYLEAVPVDVILHPAATLVGAARYLALPMVSA